MKQKTVTWAVKPFYGLGFGFHRISVRSANPNDPVLAKHELTVIFGCLRILRGSMTVNPKVLEKHFRSNMKRSK